MGLFSKVSLVDVVLLQESFALNFHLTDLPKDINYIHSGEAVVLSPWLNLGREILFIEDRAMLLPFERIFSHFEIR